MISICIPYHDTPLTAFFLCRLLGSISTQTYKDYEIVLTKEVGMAHNHNVAMMKAKGELIKFMQMDDYFHGSDSLQDIVDNFKSEDNWMISACIHTDGQKFFNIHQPEWTDDIVTGNNRLGSISTLTIRNTSKILFEETLTWVVDCDAYRRYKDKYGLPKLLKSVNVIIDVGTHRLSSTLSDELKQKEVKYLINKYE